MITRQIVRTSNDLVYIFSGKAGGDNTLIARWTSSPGVPSASSGFNGTKSVTAAAYPISVDAVYDGAAFVHVLANLTNGELYDFPFDLSTNSFRSPILISSNKPGRKKIYQSTPPHSTLSF